MKKTSKSNKLKRFEIYVPITETWIMEVYAKDEKEALELYESHSPRVFQNCTVSGWPKGDQVFIEEKGSQ